jgi:hypothetical protein
MLRTRRARPGDTLLVHAGLYKPERLNYVDPTIRPPSDGRSGGDAFESCSVHYSPSRHIDQAGARASWAAPMMPRAESA